MSGNKVGKKGWTTRYKYIGFPKYVQFFANPKSKKKFRVCKKAKGKVETIGYFEDFEIAKAIAKCLED